MKHSTDDLVAVYARAGYGKQLHDLTLEQKEATARGLEAVLEAFRAPVLTIDLLSDFPGPPAVDDPHQAPPQPLIFWPVLEHPAVTIVRELVALRDMKDRMQSLRISAVELEALVEEYARRKPAAWAAARALVGGGSC